MQKSQTSKSTIRSDPFGSVIPEPEELAIPEPVALDSKSLAVKSLRKPKAVNVDRKEEVASAAEESAKRGKQKLTVHLESELAERVKNAAYWNPRLTIARIAEQGIKNAIEKFEREHGGKYPPREGELIGGRPIK
ncbi:MAG: hypothetical protein U0798_13385 [Gemmataceae bacterium]